MAQFAVMMPLRVSIEMNKRSHEKQSFYRSLRTGDDRGQLNEQNLVERVES